jgi:hypothetical protein
MKDDVSKPIAPEMIERKLKRDPFLPEFDQLAPYRGHDKTYEGRQWEPIT